MNFDMLVLAMVALVTLIFGNLVGDAGTLKDCATTGEAKMLGGGTITCEVKKEPKP